VCVRERERERVMAVLDEMQVAYLVEQPVGEGAYFIDIVILGTYFFCFTGTKLQILPQKSALEASVRHNTDAEGGAIGASGAAQTVAHICTFIPVKQVN
jgi:hypothetical protein